VVVLLQELQVKAVSDFTSQDALELGQSSVVATFLGGQGIEDLLGEDLVFVVQNIKSNLVCNQVVSLILHKPREQYGCSLRNVQEELALDNLIVVKVTALCTPLVLIYGKEQSEYVGPELLVAPHDVLSNGECVRELLLDITAFLDCLLDLIESSGLQGHTDGLSELTIFVAALKHAFDDILHLGIDHDALFLAIDNLDTLLDVLINALMHKCLNILIPLVDVELISSLKCQ